MCEPGGVGFVWVVVSLLWSRSFLRGTVLTGESPVGMVVMVVVVVVWITVVLLRAVCMEVEVCECDEDVGAVVWVGWGLGRWMVVLKSSPGLCWSRMIA